MTQYLLGTNIISYFIKGMHPALIRRMDKATQARTIVTSVICRAEVRYGQNLMAHDDKRRKAIDLMRHELPALPWTAAADRHGEIQAHLKRQGTPIGKLNTQIAAHALAEQLIMLTHNTRHFEKVPKLKLEDWMA